MTIVNVTLSPEAVVRGQAEALAGLVARCGGQVFADVSPSGSRHVFVVFAAGAAVAQVARCRQGAGAAAAMLARQGREVSNLAGGMRAWARAGLPMVARGGGAGRVG